MNSDGVALASAEGSTAAGGGASGRRCSTSVPGVVLPLQGADPALALEQDSDRGGVTRARRGVALGGGGPKGRGGVSSRLSRNSRSVTTWSRAPLSCGSGPSSASTAETWTAASLHGALPFRGLAPSFSSRTELLGSLVGRPWGAAEGVGMDDRVAGVEVGGARVGGAGGAEVGVGGARGAGVGAVGAGVEAGGAESGVGGARLGARGAGVEASGTAGTVPRDTQGPDCGAQKNP